MNLSTLFPLIILLLFIPILLSSRRQKKQAAAMQDLQSSLSEGDVVVTTSGLRGTVVDSSYEDTVDIEIAPGVVTTWVRAAVRETVNPASDSADATASDDAPKSDDAAPLDDAPKAVDAPKTDEHPETITEAKDSAAGRGNA
ncbi:MAG TPA: preprotein translocase subunit YajC [Pseudonocardia sp.]|jgi:preprotein translocase subunit YajC|nr:preprotein translocase subunit YajC [Pseudonocardia sp.]